MATPTPKRLSIDVSEDMVRNMRGLLSDPARPAVTFGARVLAGAINDD
ncbi:hypothetical protein [Burkholderia sp. lig30]|jgi:hypothetical protein|nr:hypothetical protein [Burkholderia sp. lig30]